MSFSSYLSVPFFLIFPSYLLYSFPCEKDINLSLFSTDIFDNVVTFRKADATINLPRFDMGHSGDIYFEFKTTIRDGCLIHARGTTDYIKVSIVGESDELVAFYFSYFCSYYFYLFIIFSHIN